jgi:predicted  nucleic acid-binding Zn-ribbon protein
LGFMKELMQSMLKLQTLEYGDTQGKATAAAAAELRKLIPPQILGHYDRLRVRGKKAVTAVRNQVCTGCHMRQPLGVIMTLKHGTDIQLCDSCGRYLYLEEAPAAETPAPVVEKKPARKPRARKAAAAVAQS